MGIQTVEVSGWPDHGQHRLHREARPASTAGDITPSAEAVENLGDSFVVAWHFNNDTKTWTFYDGMEGSDLDELHHR